MGWNYLSIPKLQRCNRWSLGMDKWFYPTFYWARDYLSMLVLKWIHVSKRGPRCLPKYFHVTWPYWDRHIITPVVVNNNQIRCGYFLSKVNIWNFNRARVTAFIFDSRTFLDRKCLDMRGHEPPTFRFMPNVQTIWAIMAIHLLSHVLEYWLWWYR